MRAMRTTVSVFATLLVSMVLAVGARAAELPDFREIVKNGSPAVVKILVEHSSRFCRLYTLTCLEEERQ